MYRAVARIRTLIALLLLVAGQWGAMASAQAAPCPRATLRHSAATPPSTTTSGVVAALVPEHHHSSSPVGDLPTAPSASCGSAIALPGRVVDCLLPIPPVEDAPARVTSPPGDPLAGSFFRPPRLS